MTGPREWGALPVHLISQDPRGQTGDPSIASFKCWNAKELISAHHPESFRAEREDDRSGDPESLQLGPPRLGRSERRDEGDRRLFSYELFEKPVDQGFRWEAPSILAR